MTRYQTALLALFAVCDDVFSEGDTFTDKRDVSLHRIHRAYSDARAVLLDTAGPPIGRGR